MSRWVWCFSGGWIRRLAVVIRATMDLEDEEGGDELVPRGLALRARADSACEFYWNEVCSPRYWLKVLLLIGA